MYGLMIIGGGGEVDDFCQKAMCRRINTWNFDRLRKRERERALKLCRGDEYCCCCKGMMTWRGRINTWIEMMMMMAEAATFLQHMHTHTHTSCWRVRERERERELEREFMSHAQCALFLWETDCVCEICMMPIGHSLPSSHFFVFVFLSCFLLCSLSKT